MARRVDHSGDRAPATTNRRSGRLSAGVVAGILRDLAEGNVQPGEALPPEAALGERFGVSKPVVREAIAELAVQGVTDIHPGRPTVVRSLSGEPIGRLFDALALAYRIGPGEFFMLRRAVETEVAALAATRATASDIEALTETVELMAAEIRSIDPWVEADLSFHRTLAASSGQRLLTCLLSALESSTRETIRGAKLMRDLATTQLSLRRHIELVEAVRAHDPNRARTAMIAHFDIVAVQRAGGLSEG